MIEGDQIIPSVTGLFNELLNRPPQTSTEMERIQRALRPKGRDNEPPKGHCMLHIRNSQTSQRQATDRTFREDDPNLSGSLRDHTAAPPSPETLVGRSPHPGNIIQMEIPILPLGHLAGSHGTPEGARRSSTFLRHSEHPAGGSTELVCRLSPFGGKNGTAH